MKHLLYHRFCFAFSNNLLSRFIPLLARMKGASDFALGVVTSLPSFLTTFLQVCFARFVEKQGKDKLIACISLLIWAICWSSIAIAQSFSTFLFLLVLKSIALSAFLPIYLKTLLAFPRYKRGRLLGKLTCWEQLAALLAVLLAGFLISQARSSHLLFAFTLFSALLSIFFFYLLPPAKVKLLTSVSRKGKEEKELKRFLLTTAFLTFAVSLTSPFISVFIVEKLNGTALDLALISSISIVFHLLFSQSWGWLVDWIGRRAVMLATSLPIAFVPLVYVSSSSVIPVYLYTFISSISWAGFGLAKLAYLHDLSKGNNLIVAKYNTTLALIASLSSFLGGVIASLFGIEAVFYISFALRLSSFLLMRRLSERRGPTKARAPLFDELSSLADSIRTSLLVYLALFASLRRRRLSRLL